MGKMVLSLLVENEAGVLSRVTGLFSRRGYNIDSLAVGVTENPDYSRMTVVASGEPEVLEQIYKQLSKLEDVVEIRELKHDSSVTRELVMIKVAASVDDRHKVIAVADIFRAKVIDVSSDSVIVELTGNTDKIRAFINLLEGFTIRELVRTGVAGLARGSADEQGVNVLDN